MKCLSIFFLFTLWFCGCTQGQEKKPQMLLTSKKLITYLQKHDTAGIKKLFADTYRKEYKTANDIVSDCKLFTKMTGKYGVPSIDSAIISKDKSDANVVAIPVRNLEDSTINLKRCVLYVQFYPDRFLTDPGKILTYELVVVPLQKPKQELIILPEHRKMTTE